jgi:ceramide glucosyltransferase
MTTLFECLAAGSLAAATIQAVTALRALGRGPAPGRPDFLPPVSILKPLRGIDDRLLDSLERFCELDYPVYEVIFCAEGSSDPALRVARKVKALHPGTDIQVVVGDYRGGLNHSVNSLVAGYRAARHPLVLISDGNFAPSPGYLREAVSYLADPSVGMITHLIRATGARTLGARLENSHLNASILPSVALLKRGGGIPGVFGKSMLMRKEDLERLGGLESVCDYLVEDYILGDRIRKAGKRVIVPSAPLVSLNVYRTVREFLSRHARWNRVRLSVAGPAYFVELLANPLPATLLLLAASGFSALGAAAVGVAAVWKVALDALVQWRLGEGRELRWVWLGPLRELLTGGLWACAFFSRTVSRRGQILQITRGSRLVPVGPRV